jgi:hypothetical protein
VFSDSYIIFLIFFFFSILAGGGLGIGTSIFLTVSSNSFCFCNLSNSAASAFNLCSFNPFDFEFNSASSFFLSCAFILAFASASNCESLHSFFYFIGSCGIVGFSGSKTSVEGIPFSEISIIFF